MTSIDQEDILTTDDYESAFQLLDKDKDGKLTAKELIYTLNSFGVNPTEAELQELMMQLDLNGNGTLELEELMDMLQVDEDDQESDLKEVFKLLDHDSNGYITCSDLKSFIVTMGFNIPDEQIALMIYEADLDEDQQLCFDEFKSILYPLQSPPQIIEDPQLFN
ncbi:hypothetical protein BC833DRAFT_609585 [Globomyces pollinis-pini]|nr:hypothetical protein BC833DRAFT_609585 [Globomyces pollinis-pini]